MKKTAMALCMAALATAAFAQGTVTPANTIGTLFLTNSLLSGGTSGNTANGAPSSGGFLYEVLTAPSTVTTVDASLQGLLSAPWSDTGLTLTNSTLASGGRISGRGGAGGQVNNWPASTFQSYIIVGWSANEGASWAQLAANLLGTQFFANGWLSQGLLVNGGFIGASTIQQAATGAPDGTAAFALFGSTASVQGTPISTPTTLWLVQIPEPSSMVLAGLAFGAMAIFRRRR